MSLIVMTWMINNHLQEPVIHKIVNTLRLVYCFVQFTDERDFNPSAVVVMFPADETTPYIYDIDVPIPIFDDDVDEAESQFFYAVLQIANATNTDLVNTEEPNVNVALCNIRDNDGMNYQYSNGCCHFFLLLVQSCTLALHGRNILTMNLILILQ